MQKIKNKKLIQILILATLVILVAAPESIARRQYSDALETVYPGGSCGTCHVLESGSGQRNSYGTLFESQPNHANDPVTALKAIGYPTITIPAATNYSNQVHSNHIGPGTPGLDCATCHGSPPTYNNLDKMCIKCHPDQTPAPTATAIVVSTPVFLRVDKKAHLDVTYDLNKGRTDGEVLVSVRLNNTGNATASNVILSIEHPAGIAIISISGSEQKGNSITWSGDIIPGSGHVTRYYARGVNTKLDSIEIPLRVEYEKTSRVEKAEALAPYAASAPQAYALAISERDIEIINLTMRLAFVLIPGFEGILAIFALIGVLGMKKRHRGG